MHPGSKILVVDDEEANRLLLRDILESHGYVVYEAADGSEALMVKHSIEPHLAIVDLDMPKMNGIEFTKKAKEESKGFPVIMVTGFARFYSPADILASGVDAFLQKPLDTKKLLEIVEKL